MVGRASRVQLRYKLGKRHWRVGTSLLRRGRYRQICRFLAPSTLRQAISSWSWTSSRGGFCLSEAGILSFGFRLLPRFRECRSKFFTPAPAPFPVFAPLSCVRSLSGPPDLRV